MDKPIAVMGGGATAQRFAADLTLAGRKVHLYEFPEFANGLEDRGLSLDLKEVFGFVAGALINVGLVPQVWRLLILKTAREISLPFTLLLVIGTACWVSYGVLSSLISVILWQAITLALACAMLYAKLRYGR